ncbi:MAG: UDP-glucose/GDP-mannose dehydrogenase family protein [Nanoarchaeota archaeon]|nr:UDP-glucose/GDP-mannose dehydrogenase family protein [Nanoarchaeota archaeon]
MKISVFGSGYVGLIVGTCLADLGNEVICVDIDEDKIENLKKAIPPIYEPGLQDLLKRNIEEKRISFTTNREEAIKNSEVIFIAVGTPSNNDNKADLSFVKAVAADIGKYMNGYKVIVDKSTVPVGTADMVKDIVKENQTGSHEFDVVSNPEFLREGTAIRDFTVPDRIVIGADSEKAKKIMERLYKGIARADKPIIFTDVKSAEIIKYASNAMLATRISFMNMVANLCENAGADVKAVANGIGFDSRIGPKFLQAGIGYGGSCFPKDINAFIETLKENNCDASILEAVESVNKKQKQSLLPKIKKLVPELNGKTITIWGLAFKPKTDDMREAPSLKVISQLQKEGVVINAFDPEAEGTAKKILKNVNYFKTPYDALENSSCLVIITEWNEFRDLDKQKIKEFMKEPNIVDGRNVYEPEEMKEAGFNYIGVGR